MFSTGVVLFSLLTGTVPFPGDNKLAILKKNKFGRILFKSKYWDKISSSAKNLV